MLTPEKTYTLTTRDSTIGHWRFQNSLGDLSAGNHILSGAIPAADYVSGYTENGLTALEFRGETFVKVALPAASASDFDMGTDSFTLEVIVKATGTAWMGIIRKFFSGGGEGGSTGWNLFIEGGKCKVDVADGGDTLSTSSASINDGYWHYLAAVVDRTAAQIHLYIDGVEDAASPFSIASRTGDFSSAGVDLQIGVELTGTIDEICISKEALSAQAVSSRASGRFVEVSVYNRRFLSDLLPRIHDGNPDLDSFLVPFNIILRENLVRISRFRDLIYWDRCPEKFLPHLASNFGFELIDIKYATETERRQLLKNVIEIYRKKGTLDSIRALIEPLGFSVSMTEVFYQWLTFICNHHRLWDRRLVSTTKLWSYDRPITFESDWDGTFADNLQKWNPPLNLSSWWRLEDRLLVATGNGSDDDTNAILFNDTTAACRFEVDYTVDADHIFTAPAELGLYLRYEDTNNWLRLEYRLGTAGSQHLVLVHNDNGTETDFDLRTFPVSLIFPGSGNHRLWIWDDGADHYSAGIDDITLFYNQLVDASGIARGKKGLWVNRAETVTFNSAKVTSHQRTEIAKLFDPAFSNRKLQVHLSGVPLYAENKKQYLLRVLPNYLPAGVELELS